MMQTYIYMYVYIYHTHVHVIRVHIPKYAHMYSTTWIGGRLIYTKMLLLIEILFMVGMFSIFYTSMYNYFYLFTGWL